ncbi:MAG: hypothetical protein JOY54_08570 [Acidobacteriaceae bacterium]|nr:hypothetical protein [Acidobacteriaceae bacterium]
MLYRSPLGLVVAGLVCLTAQHASGQQSPAVTDQVPVHLLVEAGTPLRLYITQRVWYRVGENVNAKLIEPVWAFDRIVIPAGATVRGQVVNLDPVPKMVRAQAVAGGDFTPLKRAEVSFTDITFPDGRRFSLQTRRSLGLSTIYSPPRAKPQSQKTTPHKTSSGRQFLERQVQAQANARSHGLYDMVRGPNKKEWVEGYVLSKLPYHPQWYRTGTRFDAVLEKPLDFGTVQVASSEFGQVGAPPAPDSVAQMMLLETISSADARVGDSMVGVLSQPLFTPDHKLVLPEGTRLTGKITLAQPAKYLHRGGKLRFAIDDVQVPAIAKAPVDAAFQQRPEPVRGQLAAAEVNPQAVKVDSEGTAKATESKTRLLRPVIAGLIAAKTLDNDSGKQTATGSGSPNTGALALGGFSGFGIFGTALSFGPHQIGEVLGFYGLAWSVFTNVISRGGEVKFEKNTSMAIRFGTPPKGR